MDGFATYNLCLLLISAILSTIIVFFLCDTRSLMSFYCLSHVADQAFVSVQMHSFPLRCLLIDHPTLSQRPAVLLDDKNTTSLLFYFCFFSCAAAVLNYLCAPPLSLLVYPASLPVY